MDFIIDHLSKSYEQKKVLEDVSFAFPSGKIYGLLGRNGAGKTTLFNCLNRDITVDGGAFFFEDEQGRREVEPEDIGYVLSTPTVPDFLTGREFLKFFMDINRGSITDPKPLDDYFDFISIPAEDRDRLMKDYSHGMKNKMQMLINFIANPTLFLLDEPLTSLDVVVAEEMKQLLRECKRAASSSSPHTCSTWQSTCAMRLCCSATGCCRAWITPRSTTTLSRKRFLDALREDGHA